MTSKPAMFAQEKWPFYQLLDQHRLLKIQSERYHLNSSSFQWKTSSFKKQMAPPHNTKVPREFEFQIPQPIWNTTFSRINHIGSLSIFLSFEMSPQK